MKIRHPVTGEEFDLHWTDEVAADLRQHEEARCQHRRTEPRRVTVAGGSIQFRQQCLACGELIGSAIRKATLLEGAPPSDQGLLDRCRSQREKQYYDILRKHQELQRTKNDEWWVKYDAYLKTSEWRRIHDQVIRRAGGFCEGCGRKSASQVHHITYQHVFAEFLFELVAVCDECHQRLHQEERPAIEEWSDDLPCAGCRYQAEKNDRRWCGVLEVFAVDALSERGGCGPTHAAYEPMR